MVDVFTSTSFTYMFALKLPLVEKFLTYRYVEKKSEWFIATEKDFSQGRGTFLKLSVSPVKLW